MPSCGLTSELLRQKHAAGHGQHGERRAAERALAASPRAAVHGTRDAPTGSVVVDGAGSAFALRWRNPRKGLYRKRTSTVSNYKSEREREG